MNFRVSILIGLCAAAFALPSAASSRSQTVPADDKGGNAWLGVYLQEVTRDIAESLDLEDAHGALVSEVIDKSPADDAGIRRGDVIISVDGNEVSNPDDLIHLVRRHDPGDRLRFEAARDGKTREFQVTLAESPGRMEERHSVMPPDESDAPSMPEGAAPPAMREFHKFRMGPSAFLGVRVVDMNEDLGEYFQRDRGALVINVEEGTAAEKAGLKSGDVITAVDGHSVEKAQDLIDAIAKGDKGDRVAIEFVRKGASQSIDATLDEAPGLSSLQIPRLRQRMFSEPAPGKSEELRDQMNDLRRELDDLRRQLREMRDRKD